MKKMMGLAILGMLLSSAPAFAQGAVVDVTAGWAFSDGVSGDSYTVPLVGTFDRIDPKDGFKWGVGIGAQMGSGAEVGFLFGQQQSVLQIGGTSTIDVGDMNVNNYHGYFAYNVGVRDSAVRPYVMFGVGATHFGGVDYSTLLGSGTIDGQTKFSWTAGAGVRVYASPNVGLKFGAQWTPTYIKTDAAGWWCDPFWGCYVLGDAQYANQFDLSGGVTLRF